MKRSTFAALIVGVLAGLGVELALAQPVDPSLAKVRNLTVTNSLAVGNDLTVSDDLTVTDTTKTELLDAGNVFVAGRAWSKLVDAGAAYVANNLGVGGTAYISVADAGELHVANAFTAGTGGLFSVGATVNIATDLNVNGSNDVTFARNLRVNGDWKGTAGANVATNTTPTVVACSGTAASVTGSNGSWVVVFDVGTDCTGESTAVITLEAASTGYICNCSSTTADRTVLQKVIPPANATTVTVQNIVISTGANGDWTDSADVACTCHGY